MAILFLGTMACTWIVVTLCKGEYKETLRYKRTLKEIQQVDRVAKVEILMIVVVLLVKLTYQIFVYIFIRNEVKNLTFDPASAIQVLALTLLWIVYVIEIKQYLHLATTLNSAN
jgi:hypothetical protein